MGNEFYNLSKSIANLPQKVAMAAIEASEFPEGNPGDRIFKKESKYALRERYWDWNERKNSFKRCPDFAQCEKPAKAFDGDALMFECQTVQPMED